MDIRHYYIEAGEGAPLLLLHGNGESSAYFQHQIEPFARHFHVYALDTRGHGQTPRGSAPFTFRQFSADLNGFMDRLGLEKAHILGFSDGGIIALRFALQYPERVDRLIVDGANLNPRGIKRGTLRLIELEYAFWKRLSPLSSAARRKAELFGIMVHEPDMTMADLHGIQSKTLVIAGTEDLIRESHTRRIAWGIPHSRLCFLPGDHAVAAKNPEAFNRAVLDFLTE